MMEISGPSEIDVGIDLVTAAQNHVSFLNNVNKYPGLYGGPVLERAIWRYTHLWLPLAAQHKDKVLSAPLDVEWVWHCHMLSPVAYLQDCLHGYQHVPDHTILDTFTYQQALIATEQLWKYAYLDQPFDVDLENCDHHEDQDPRSISHELSYDLIAAASRQKVFQYQVSLPHYLDNLFLEKSVTRYKKYLFLKRKNPDTFLVPCYDMDLIWHSHMNHPLCYKTVTESILGAILNHDDSVNDRNEGSRLNNSYAITRQLWKTEYDEHFPAYGAMYRGDPPVGKLNTIDKQDNFRLLLKQVHVQVDKLEVSGERSSNLGKFKLFFLDKKELLLSDRNGQKEVVDMSEKLMTVKGPGFEFERLGSFTKFSNCMDSDNLHVQLCQPQSFFCFKASESCQGEAKIEFDKMTKKFDSCNQSITEKVVLDLDTDLTITMDLTLTLKKLGSCDMWLVIGDYGDCVMPEQVEQLWGPVPLPRLPQGVENKCSVASHRLKTHEGQTEFTCRIIHSLPLMMSSVQVFHHDKMVAVAHVIGSDQIPKPTEVGDGSKCVTLEPKNGERAMIIKNATGDWGILIGRWDGYKIGMPAVRGTRAKPGRPGSQGRPGYLTLLLYKVASRKWELLSLEDPYLTEEFRFDIADAHVDFKIGKVSVRGDRNELAEHLALTFAVSLLHVFLQPRPASWEPGQSLEPSADRRGVRRIKYVKAEKLAFVLAAGLLIATPSNHFFRKKLLGHSSESGGGRFGYGAVLGHDESCKHDNDNQESGNAETSVFGNLGEDGTSPNDIATQLLGGSEQDQGGNNTILDVLYGAEENTNAENDNFSSKFFDNHNDNDMYNEDFNTFLGDVDMNTNTDGGDNSGGGTAWSFGYEDGGGCGGCGGCGG